MGTPSLSLLHLQVRNPPWAPVGVLQEREVWTVKHLQLNVLTTGSSVDDNNRKEVERPSPSLSVSVHGLQSSSFPPSPVTGVGVRAGSKGRHGSPSTHLGRTLSPDSPVRRRLTRRRVFLLRRPCEGIPDSRPGRGPGGTRSSGTTLSHRHRPLPRCEDGCKVLREDVEPPERTYPLLHHPSGGVTPNSVPLDDGTSPTSPEPRG